MSDLKGGGRQEVRRRSAVWLVMAFSATILLSLGLMSRAEAQQTLTPQAQGGQLQGDEAPPVQTVRSLPDIRVRTGLHPTFGRIVFDWTGRVGYEVSVDGNALTIRFDQPVTIDVSNVPVRLGRYVAAAAVETGDNRTAAGFTVKADARIRHFYVGNRVVIDIYEPADAAARAAGQAPIADLAQLVGRPAQAAPEPLPVQPAPSVQIATTPGGPVQPLDLPPPVPPAAPPAASGSPDSGPSVPGPSVPGQMAGDGGRDESTGVTITTSPTDRGVLIDFAWAGTAPAAAVFHWGDVTWIAFDRPANVATAELTGGSAGQIQRVMVVDNPDRSLLLRLDTRPGLRPHVRRDENTWRVRLLEDAPLPDQPLIVTGGASGGLVIEGSDGAAAINAIDPMSGIRMIVVPIRGSSRGVVPGRQFVPFDLLETAQGVAIRPRPDALPVASRRGGVEIGGGGGLAISADALAPAALPPSPLAPAAPAETEATRLLTEMAIGGRDPFDFARWVRSPELIAETRQALQQAVVSVAPPLRTGPRLTLARFLLANGFAAEAMGVVETAVSREPAIADRVDVVALTGAAAYMQGHYDQAETAFNDARFDQDPAYALWRAAVAAGRERHNIVGEFASGGVNVPIDFPIPLRAQMLISIGHSTLASGRLEAGRAMIDNLTQMSLDPKQAAMVEYLSALADKVEGNADIAIDRWRAIADAGVDRKVSVLARLAQIETAVETGSMKPADGAAAIDKLRFDWRGDQIEMNMLKILGEMREKAGNYHGALGAWKEAVTYYPDAPQSAELARRMSDTFAWLFVEGGSSKLAPLDALALFYDYRELTPVGERGDEMIRIMADKLAAVDLLDEASELLRHQVAFRLSGADRSRVGARLALIRLLDGDPAGARQALQDSVTAEMTSALINQRQRLEARALADLGEFDGARAAIDGDDGAEARRLRAEFAWTQENWAAAAEAYRRVIEPLIANPTSRIDDVAARETLKAAIAAVLAGNDALRRDLRRQMGERMSNTAVAGAFRFVTDPIARPESADFRSALGQIGSYESFLAAYRQQVATQRLSTIN